MPEVCSYFPPSMVEHLFEPSTTPTQYYFFWSIGGVMVIITGMLIYPRAKEFWRLGTKIREEQNLILVPFSHAAYRAIVTLPLITSIAKYITFLVPSSIYLADFIIHFYEGIVLFFFAQLLIMYLGTLENSMKALSQTKPSKFYAVPPFGCCLKPCISSANMNHKDFRRLYFMVLQFTILSPIFSFWIMVETWPENQISLWILAILDLISSMICVYALFALMTAAHGIFERHKIHHKFWCIKGLVMVVVIPNLVFRFVDPSYYGYMAGVNETYSDHVIADSWASFAEIILFTILAVFFRKYFTTEDALYVNAHAKQKTHNVRYSKLNVLNKVNEATDDEVTDIECETVEMTAQSLEDGDIIGENQVKNGQDGTDETNAQDKTERIENKE